jgi:hypothetical protein
MPESASSDPLAESARVFDKPRSVLGNNRPLLDRNHIVLVGLRFCKRVLLGAQLAREDLESGFTTVRNLGHSGIDGDAALRDAINAGRLPGPRTR